MKQKRDRKKDGDEHECHQPHVDFFADFSVTSRVLSPAGRRCNSSNGMRLLSDSLFRSRQIVKITAATGSEKSRMNPICLRRIIGVLILSLRYIRPNPCIDRVSTGLLTYEHFTPNMARMRRVKKCPNSRVSDGSGKCAKPIGLSANCPS
jgi:hypothetical protein